MKRLISTLLLVLLLTCSLCTLISCGSPAVQPSTGSFYLMDKNPPDKNEDDTDAQINRTSEIYVIRGDKTVTFYDNNGLDTLEGTYTFVGTYYQMTFPNAGETITKTLLLEGNKILDCGEGYIYTYLEGEAYRPGE